MRAESSKGKKRWSKDDIAKLKSEHGSAENCLKSHEFFNKLSNKFPDRTVASIIEECRRLGLKPKRNPRSDKCDDCELELAGADRVGNKCRKCYNKKWYDDHK